MPIKRLQRPLKVEKVKLIRVMWERGECSTDNPDRLVHYFYNDYGVMVACYDEINGDPSAFMPLKTDETIHTRVSAGIKAELDDVPADSGTTEGMRSHRVPVHVSMRKSICVTALRGSDRPEDPEREVSYYYDYKGNLMACVDLINGVMDWIAPIRCGRER